MIQMGFFSSYLIVEVSVFTLYYILSILILLWFKEAHERFTAYRGGEWNPNILLKLPQAIKPLIPKFTSPESATFHNPFSKNLLQCNCWITKTQLRRLTKVCRAIGVCARVCAVKPWWLRCKSRLRMCLTRFLPSIVLHCVAFTTRAHITAIAVGD